MDLIGEDMEQQVFQTLTNLQEVAKAAGGNLNNIVKLTVYLIDLTYFPIFNQIMSQFFTEPYPARATIQVSALPKAAKIEIDAIMVIG
jgi:reactive intermediate/imine deaminase